MTHSYNGRPSVQLHTRQRVLASLKRWGDSSDVAGAVGIKVKTAQGHIKDLYESGRLVQRIRQVGKAKKFYYRINPEKLKKRVASVKFAGPISPEYRGYVW